MCKPRIVNDSDPSRVHLAEDSVTYSIGLDPAVSHPTASREDGVRLGDYFLSYLEDELRCLGRTATDLQETGYGS